MIKFIKQIYEQFNDIGQGFNLRHTEDKLNIWQEDNCNRGDKDRSEIYSKLLKIAEEKKCQE